MVARILFPGLLAAIILPASLALANGPHHNGGSSGSSMRSAPRSFSAGRSSAIRSAPQGVRQWNRTANTQSARNWNTRRITNAQSVRNWNTNRAANAQRVRNGNGNRNDWNRNRTNGNANWNNRNRFGNGSNHNRRHCHNRFVYYYYPYWFYPYFDYSYYPYNSYAADYSYYSDASYSQPVYDGGGDYTTTYEGPADNSDTGGYDAGSAGASSGSTVRDVQRQLARAGYYRGAVDGVMGSRTFYAIRAYERAQGLPVDGQIDQQLLAKLGLQ